MKTAAFPLPLPGTIRLIGLLILLISPVLAQQKVSYTIEYSSPGRNQIHVVIALPTGTRGPLTLVIPRAIPGGYNQQFYDRYVGNVRSSSDDGSALKVEREEGPRWRLGLAGIVVAKIEYDVDISRLEREILNASDTSKIRPGYVGLLGYSVFGYVEGMDNLPISLHVQAPEGWPVFTTLAPRMPADRTRTTAEALNFYALADSQVAMGPAFEVRQLRNRMPLYFVIYAEVTTDVNKHSELFADAFEKVTAYFGTTPFEHYTAYLEILRPMSDRHEYGFSMEHIDSSTYFLGADRAISSATTAQELARHRFNFAHHIAHSWIPKRVYGSGYLPFAWELAPQIDTIWFNEGFARYAAIEALADAMPDAAARDFRQRQLTGLREMVAGMPEFIRSMPLPELSRVGSLLYGADFRTGKTLFSKGALMAAEMDQRIRELAGGRKRLRDSLRELVKWGEQSGRAFKVDELPDLIASPVAVNGIEIRRVMDRWLAGSTK